MKRDSRVPGRPAISRWASRLGAARRRTRHTQLDHVYAHAADGARWSMVSPLRCICSLLWMLPSELLLKAQHYGPRRPTPSYRDAGRRRLRPITRSDLRVAGADWRTPLPEPRSYPVDGTTVVDLRVHALPVRVGPMVKSCGRPLAQQAVAIREQPDLPAAVDTQPAARSAARLAGSAASRRSRRAAPVHGTPSWPEQRFLTTCGSVGKGVPSW